MSGNPNTLVSIHTLIFFRLEQRTDPPQDGHN